MNTRFIVALLFAFLPFASGAQLNGIMNKVKNKAKQTTDRKIDQEIDKTLDGAEGTPKKTEPTSPTAPKPAPAPAETKQETKEPVAEEAPIRSFTKYDFIPGELILYYENFEGEALAERNEFGLEETRLVTEGKGETQPVADNKTKEGKMLNRRVEFIKL